MESKRNLEEKKASTTVKEECTIAFEAFWAKGIEYYFQAFLDGSPIALNQLGLWTISRKNDKAIEAWRDKLTEQKNTKGDLFSIQGEVLLGIIHLAWFKAQDEARNCFDKAAKANHAGAQFYLGMMYDFDSGFYESGKALALQYYTKAAKNPTPCLQALATLGYAYEQAAHGIKTKNHDVAHKYYTQAAAFGDSVAACHLAQMLLKEKPEEKNDNRAVDLLRQSARGGYWEALIKLADLYDQGRGVPKDGTEADRLYDLADEISPDSFHLAPVRQLHSKTLAEWIVAAESGDPLILINFLVQFLTKMTFQEDKKREENKKIIEQQLELLANERETKGGDFPENKQVVMGILFLTIGNSNKAKKCFSSLKERSINAQVFLAQMEYANKNVLKAIKGHKQVLKRCPDHPIALYYLGEIYHGKKKFDSAVNYFTKADNLGVAPAAYQLAFMSYKGESLHRDGRLAFQYWQKAATRGDLAALIHLAPGFPSNRARETIRLLRVPVAQGDIRAYCSNADVLFKTSEMPENVKEAIRLWSIVAAQKEVTRYSIHSAKKLGIAYSQEEKHHGLKNIELSAFYFRQAVEGGDAEARRHLIKLFDKNNENPIVIYHAAMAIDEPDIRETLNKLALNNPDIFDSLSEQDDWKKVKSVLPEKTARIVFARKHQGVSQTEAGLLVACPFSLDVTRVVSSYLFSQGLFKAIREHEQHEKIVKGVKQVLDDVVQKVVQNS